MSAHQEEERPMVGFRLQSTENEWSRGLFECAPDSPEVEVMRQRLVDGEPIMLSGRTFTVVCELDWSAEE